MAIDEQKLEMIISDLGECIDALKETKEQLKVEYEEKNINMLRIHIIAR